MKTTFALYFLVLSTSLAFTTACANGNLNDLISAIAANGQAPGANAAYADETTQAFNYSTAVTLTEARAKKLDYYQQGQSPKALRSLLGSPNRIEMSADGSSTEIYHLVTDGVSTRKLIVTYVQGKGTWNLQ